MDPRLPVTYRERIYSAYVTGRDRPLAPVNLDGLAPRLPFLSHLIRQHFPPRKDARIMDLGCGHGAFLYALSSAGYEQIEGVDGSLEQVQAAHRLGIQGVRHGDVMETLASTGTASFDVVISFDLIEHFTRDELLAMIDQIRRVLKPGGSWIVHTPNGEGPFAARMRYNDFTHEIAFTRTSITQALRASGFEKVRCFEDRPVIHGPLSAFRACLWSVIRWVLQFYLAVETGKLDRHAVLSQNFITVASTPVQ